MKRFGIASVILCIIAVSGAGDLMGQGMLEERTKLAQTGMQFLSVSVDARAAAMGDAMTAQDVSSVAMFYNPASMASMNHSVHVALGRNQWIAGINHNLASIAFRPANGAYGTVGFSLLSVDYGELLGTIRSDTEQGFTDTGTFSPTSLAAGVGYAREISDRFAVGAHVKYARQALGSSVMSINNAGNRTEQDNSVSTMAVDFGVLYRTGFRSLNFAVSARNFSRELTYAEESFELPLSFQVGVAMDLMDFTAFDQNIHSFMIAADAMHPRDYMEQARVGAEYVFMNTLALRAGYVFPVDEQSINLGAGLQLALGGIGFGFDYTYTEFGTLGNVNRLSLQLSFD